MAVEVAPHQFADPRIQSFGFVRVGCQSAKGVGISGTRRKGAQSKSYAQSAGASYGGEVALGFVLAAPFGKEGFQRRQGFVFIQIKSLKFHGGASAFDGIRDGADGHAWFGLRRRPKIHRLALLGSQLLEHRAFVRGEDLVWAPSSRLHGVGWEERLRVVGVYPFASALKRRADGFVALAFIDFVFETVVQPLGVDVFGQGQQCVRGCREGASVHGVQGNAKLIKFGPKRLDAAAQQRELVCADPVFAPCLGREHHHRVYGTFSRRRGEQRGVVGGTKVASNPDK